MLKNDGEVLDYLEVIGHGKKLADLSLPVVIVPTTAGTGSEVTKNAVLKSPVHNRKVSLRSSAMLPDAVIVDPELMLSLPASTTIYTGMDAITQVIEPFISSMSNPLVDAICSDAIPRGLPALKLLLEDPGNLDKREEMAFVSLIGGMALANAKLGAVHGFAGPIGGMFDIPHGLVCAILLPNCLKVNGEAVLSRGSDKDKEKYKRVSQLLTGNRSSNINDAVKLIEDFNSRSGIPGLSEYGVTVKDIERIVSASENSSSMKGNTLKLTRKNWFGL